MKRRSSAYRRAVQRDHEERGKQQDAKLNGDLRLSKAARQIAERDVYPALPLPGYKRDAKLAAINCLIANLLHRDQQGKSVRVGRNASKVANYHVETQAQNALVKGGLAVETVGFYDRVRQQGSETRYRASEDLLRLFTVALESDGGVAYQPSDLIVLKDEDKITIPIPDDLPEDAIEYLSDREWLIAKFNVVNGRHALRYHIWDIADECYNGKVGRPFCNLKAVYNNGSFKQGGRLYADYQNLRRVERSTLTIDGVPTVELDYACLHPSMLYNGKGQPVPGDAYAIGIESCDELRRGVKIAFNALLNARTAKAALSACNLALSDFDAEGRVKPYDEMQKARRLKREMESRGLRFKEVLAAVRRHHAPIAEYFGQGWGIRLQNQDVELVYAVCDHFCGQGVACLPVHDSFIVQEQYADELRSVMVEAYRNRYKFDPIVKRSDG